MLFSGREKALEMLWKRREWLEVTKEALDSDGARASLLIGKRKPGETLDIRSKGESMYLIDQVNQAQTSCMQL